MGNFGRIEFVGTINLTVVGIDTLVASEEEQVARGDREFEAYMAAPQCPEVAAAYKALLADDTAENRVAFHAFLANFNARRAA